MVCRRVGHTHTHTCTQPHPHSQKHRQHTQNSFSLKVTKRVDSENPNYLWAIYERGLGNSGLGRRLCPPRDQVGEQCVSRETPFLLLLLSLQIMRVFMHLLIIKALFVCKLLFDTLAHPVPTTVLLVISRLATMFCYILPSKPLDMCRPIILKTTCYMPIWGG